MTRKMETLKNRVHDIENINLIVYPDRVDCGNAPFRYGVYNARTGEHVQDILFQNGPRKEPGSTPGLTDADLLDIVYHRLKAYTKGPFWCEETMEAACCVYAALAHLNRRSRRRKEKGLLGTSQHDNQDFTVDEYLRKEVADQIG